MAVSQSLADGIAIREFLWRRWRFQQASSLNKDNTKGGLRRPKDASQSPLAISHHVAGHAEWIADAESIDDLEVI